MGKQYCCLRDDDDDNDDNNDDMVTTTIIMMVMVVTMVMIFMIYPTASWRPFVAVWSPSSMTAHTLWKRLKTNGTVASPRLWRRVV